MRPIDADRLKQAINTDFWEHWTQCHDSNQVSLIEDLVMYDIDEMPTITPPNEPLTLEHGGGERRAAQPGLGGVDDGLSAWMDRGMSAPGYWMPEPDGVPRITQKREHRSDRLKCLGNAVVPQQFYPVFQAIADIERGIIHG